MNVVIRADASSNIGSGHIMRCLTLAMSLKKFGFKVSFACADLTGNLVPFIKTKGFEVVLLPVPDALKLLQTPPEYRWQADHQQKDAKFVTQHFQSESTDLIIVDHYGLDVIWHQTIRMLNAKLVVIDDLINRELDCDMVINPNVIALSTDPYQGLIKKVNCRNLTGPHYALLRPEVYELAHQKRPTSGSNKQVCVFLGYIDPDNVTGKVIEGLLKLRTKVSIHLILNPLHPNFEALLQQAAEHNNITTYTKFVELIGLFKKCDVVVGAGGGASWERCCLGIPSIQVALTENQVAVCEQLSQQKAIKYLGQGRDITADDVFQVTEMLLSDDVQYQLIADSARNLVDGLGVHRVIAEICEHRSKLNLPVFLRTLTKADADMIYEWQHEPNMRRHCRIDAPPDKIEHIKWIDNRVEDTSSLTEVIVHDDVPVGMIRLDWAADMQAMEVSILLTTSVQGFGIAKLALNLLIARFPETPIVAYINEENFTSQHLFRKIGFVTTGQNNWWYLERDSDINMGSNG